MHEQWKPVDGFDGYEVSDQGRVRSVDRVDALGRRRPGKVLSQIKIGDYLSVVLYRGGDRRMMSVANMVADAFVPGRDGARMVRHVNGEKHDNRACNLVWRKRGMK